MFNTELNPDEVLAWSYSWSSTRRNMRCLKPGCEINDEIMNTFIALMRPVCATHGSFIANTFVIPGYIANGYDYVKRQSAGGAIVRQQLHRSC